MQHKQPSLFMRDDTMFGVCQAIGDDFGFSPLWLRVPLAVLLIYNPVAVIGTYLAAGAVVFVSRWMFPAGRRTAAAAPAAAQQALPVADNNQDLPAIAA